MLMTGLKIEAAPGLVVPVAVGLVTFALATLLVGVAVAAEPSKTIPASGPSCVLPDTNGQAGAGIVGESTSGDLVFQRTARGGRDRRVALIQQVLTDAGFYSAAIDGAYGLATARAVEAFQADHGMTVDGVVNGKTGRALGLPFWDAAIRRCLNPPFRDDARYPEGTSFDFRSLIGAGYLFSGQPDVAYSSSDALTRRAIRTNNPGALNISQWQRDGMQGYVGCTSPDRDGNRTTVYEAPEYGVAAWGFLIRKVYFSGMKDKVTVGEIVDKYRGTNSRDPYIDGYKKFSNGVLREDYEIDLYDNIAMSKLAIAAYSHEFGFWYPLTDEQVRAGLALTDSYIDSGTTDAVAVAPEEMDPGLYLQPSDEAEQDALSVELEPSCAAQPPAEADEP